MSEMTREQIVEEIAGAIRDQRLMDDRAMGLPLLPGQCETLPMDVRAAESALSRLEALGIVKIETHA